MGRDPASSPAARRAGDAGLRSSWRAFQSPGDGLDCWIQVAPLLDAADADLVLAWLGPERAVANPAFAGRVVAPPELVVAPDVPSARGVAATEQALEGSGRPYRSLVLWFAGGRHVVVGALSGPAAAVTWAWWGEVAARQVAALPD